MNDICYHLYNVSRIDTLHRDGGKNSLLVCKLYHLVHMHDYDVDYVCLVES